MAQGGWKAALALAVAALAGVPRLQAQDSALLAVVVNMVPRGDHVVRLTADGDVLVPPDTLVQVGLVNLPPADAPELSLRSLAPDLAYHLDEQGALLQITAEPHFFAPQRIPFRRTPGHEALRRGQGSVYLNYAVDHYRDGDFRYQSLTARAELAAQAAGWLGLTDFVFDPASEQAPVIRRLSRLLHDGVQRRRRWVLGDFFADSGDEGSTLLLGGLSVANSFAMSPDLYIAPGPEVAGTLSTPSQVEVYVNGTLVSREDLQPGPFEFLDLPLPGGASTTELRIRDAFGREQSFRIPGYLSSLSLKPGLRDYAYGLGFRRLGFGEQSFRYGEPAFLGFHRLGLSRTLTGGLRLEADPHLASGAASMVYVFPRAGEIDATLAASGGEAGFGGALSLRYLYAGSKTSFSLALAGFSPSYGTLSLPESDRLLEARASIGGSGRWSSFSAAASYAFSQAGEQTPVLNLNFGTRLSASSRLRLSLRATGGQNARTEGSLAVDLTPQRRATAANLEVRAATDLGRASARLMRGAPQGPGFGYQVEASATIPQWEPLRGELPVTADLQAGLQLNAGWGIYTAELALGDWQSYRFGAAGSVALLDGALRVSRPLEQSFALARVEGAARVRISHNGTPAGRTDRRGTLLIPGLVPFVENRIALEPLDLPINLDVPATELYYVPPYRGGAAVEFLGKTVQGILGRLYWLEDGQRAPAEMAGLTLEGGGTVQESVVGIGGEFYLENLPPGRYTGRLFLGAKQGRFELLVPRSTELQVDLGDIECSPEPGSP
jgi:outer membrane usher protein